MVGTPVLGASLTTATVTLAMDGPLVLTGQGGRGKEEGWPGGARGQGDDQEGLGVRGQGGWPGGARGQGVARKG